MTDIKDLECTQCTAANNVKYINVAFGLGETSVRFYYFAQN